MKRKLLALIAVSGLSLTAVQPAQAASPRPQSAASRTAETDSSARSIQRKIVNHCYNVVSRPRTVDWCGNTADEFRSLRWSSWRAHEARARGIARINDCNPSCADGTLHRYGVKLRLHRDVWVNGHPRFIRVTFTFLDGPHEGYRNTLPLPRKPYRR